MGTGLPLRHLLERMAERRVVRGLWVPRTNAPRPNQGGGETGHSHSPVPGPRRANAEKLPRPDHHGPMRERNDFVKASEKNTQTIVNSGGRWAFADDLK